MKKASKGFHSDVATIHRRFVVFEALGLRFLGLRFPPYYASRFHLPEPPVPARALLGKWLVPVFSEALEQVTRGK